MATPEARARFEAIHLLVRDPLARFLARRAPVDEVEDLFAETMVVLWRRIADVPQGAELAWTFGVARRVLANHRRGGRRLSRLVERIGVTQRGGERQLTLGDDPELAVAMTKLRHGDAEILRLWAWDDLGPREIGVVLGISANAASIRLTRAKGRLRLLLEAEGRRSPAAGGHLSVAERKEAR